MRPTRSEGTGIYRSWRHPESKKILKLDANYVTKTYNPKVECQKCERYYFETKKDGTIIERCKLVHGVIDAKGSCSWFRAQMQRLAGAFR